MYLRKYPLRFAVVFIVLLAGLLYSVVFLFYIQIFRSSFLARLAQRQHEHSVVLEPTRGTIYDRNLRPLAINLPVYSVFANARVLNKRHDRDAIMLRLAGIIKMDPALLLLKLKNDKYFVWIVRKLPQDVYERVEEAKLPGIGFVKESKRFYPNKTLAAHLIGFAGMDNTGLEGLERDYDRYLKGQEGSSVVMRDAHQRELLLEKGYVAPVDGLDLVLTIDETIQFIAERALENMYRKYNAKGASIIVLDPRTGEILAFANRPTYNLEEPGKSPTENRVNRAIVFTYEPGSVFKIVTAAAALQEEVVKETDVINCERGTYRVANHILHDHEPEGLLTFRQVIERSSNIGTVKVAQRLGPRRVYNYAHHFRFGMRTGIDLPGEAKGYLKPVRLWSKTSIGAVPIGQEVTVTALQLAGAIAAIANNGIYMRPYVVRSVRDAKGRIVKEGKPVILDKIMTQQTSLRLRSILQGAVDNGTGKKAKIPGVTVGGKTGTAQKVVDGAYSHAHFYATFIGFAPVGDPRLAAVVVFDDPHPVYYGGSVAAPVFQEVVADALKYLNARGMSK
ncbi:MAG: penicillin-binding transpeptidase domain-containing protein [Candidatus Omnitrophota bacterium]|nr:penicillin-binding transpeptidase domain-containing protein [Candidatus Omnitrophota bacterium]